MSKKIYLEPKIQDYWLSKTNYYAIQSLETFLNYFLPRNSQYQFSSQDDATIAIWDIQQDNADLMRDDQLNLMICVENCNHFKNYKHYNQFGNYGNSKINIYYYNHISYIQETKNDIAIPMIHVYIYYFKTFGHTIHPSKMVPFPMKKFCLVMNRSQINPHIIAFQGILSQLGTVDNISMFDDQLGTSSCYHSEPLLNLLQEYKFILCIENSYDDAYITEKIFNCLYAHTIPLYLGSSLIEKYICKYRIINLQQDPQNVLELITSMNEELYQKIISVSPISSDYNDENYLSRLSSFIDNWKPNQKMQSKQQVFYINLDRRKDRSIEFLDKIKVTSLADSEIHRFSALDGSNLQHQLLERDFANDPIFKIMAHNRNINNPSLQPGVLGCFLSHYFLLKTIANQSASNDFVFIFEDDVFFSKNEFKNELEMIQNCRYPWDLLFVGGRWSKNFVPNGDWNFFTKINEHFYLRHQTNPDYQKNLGKSMNLDRGAMGYCVKLSSIPKILNEIDTFLNNHKFEAIDAIYVAINIVAADFFPHLFYSPLHYNKSDIQKVSQVQENCVKIAYLDLWQEFKNCPVSFEDIPNPDAYKGERTLIQIHQGVGIFHFNYLSKMMHGPLKLVQPDDADIIICSQFGNSRLRYPNTTKICLVYESNFTILSEPNTFYISSNVIDDPRHFYIPLTVLYFGFSIYDQLQQPRNFTLKEIEHRQHCCSIISNCNGEFRNQFLFHLMDYACVDNYGKLYQNVHDSFTANACWYHPALSNVISQYKFMICMENTCKIGYHSEKILHAYKNNVIPIYWGDTQIDKVFNPVSMINVNRLGMRGAIQKIVQLLDNDQEYMSMLNQPIFHSNSVIQKYSEKDFELFKKKWMQDR